MRLRWRLPLALSACVVLAQLFPLSPLVDVVSWTPPATARLAYPLLHALFAPFTLLADWLNGGSRRDLEGFAAWTVAAYVLARLAVRRTGGRRALREAACAALFVAALAAFVAWGALAPRPIPQLTATGPDALVLDLHSHTALSHDGRGSFGIARNAAWHARAGFDVAFVTDHNVWRALGHGGTGARAVNGARLLDGEEISLSGIHLLALGTDSAIPNKPWDSSWDATGALVRRLHADSVFLVPTLPEDWARHTGEEFGQLSNWGVDGFEVWTSAPQAMDLPPDARRSVIAWSRLENRPVFGSTDMHGFGFTASVWNVVQLPGWRALDDDALKRAILAHFRAGGFASNQVVALRRWLPDSRLGSAFAVPVNLLMLLRTASRLHALALLGWIWVVAALARPRRDAPIL